MSGPKLLRPGKDHATDIRQELQEIGERNAVECKIGNAKRKLGLSLIIAKLQVTTGAMIGMDIFIPNMEKNEAGGFIVIRIRRNLHHSTICRKEATGNKHYFGGLNGGITTVQQTLINDPRKAFIYRLSGDF